MTDCSICGETMDGSEVFDDCCDDCAISEGLIEDDDQ